MDNLRYFTRLQKKKKAQRKEDNIQAPVTKDPISIEQQPETMSDTEEVQPPPAGTSAPSGEGTSNSATITTAAEQMPGTSSNSIFTTGPSGNMVTQSHHTTTVPTYTPLPSGITACKVPTFGASQKEDPSEFLQDFCEYAKLYHLNNSQTKHLFLMSLKDRAKRWFRINFPEFDGVECSTIFNAFKEEFYPQGIDWEKEISYDTLKQQYAESVHSYALRVEQLATKLNKSDVGMMQTFIRGLLPTYKRSVLSRGPMSFKEACKIATLLQSAETVTQEDEQQDKTLRTLNELVTQVNQLQSSVKNTTERPSTTETRPPRVTPQQFNKTGEQKVTCNFCNKKGHVQNECRLWLSQNREASKMSSSFESVVCLYCGKKGHYATDCRTRLSQMSPNTPQTMHRGQGYQNPRSQNDYSRAREYSQRSNSEFNQERYPQRFNQSRQTNQQKGKQFFQ